MAKIKKTNNVAEEEIPEIKIELEYSTEYAGTEDIESEIKRDTPANKKGD